MKRTRQGKRSAARTKHQMVMDRMRSRKCIECGGDLVRYVSPDIGDWLPQNNICGPCRRKEFLRGD
jgi:hypothetical protein